MSTVYLATQVPLAVCGLTGLAWLLRDHLLRRGFSSGASPVLIALALLQPALLAPATMGSAFVFALCGYLVGAGAGNFIQHQDARRVVLLGGAIAGAELVNPAGGMLAAAMLPLVLRPEDTRRDSRKTTGFLILLLFLPAVFACGLAYLWLTRHAGTLLWFANGKPSALTDALAIVPVLPGLAFGRMVTPSAVAVVIVVLAWWAGGLLLAAMERISCTQAILASMGPLALLLIADWPETPQRTRNAFVAAGATLALTWAIAGVQFL